MATGIWLFCAAGRRWGGVWSGICRQGGPMDGGRTPASSEPGQDRPERMQRKTLPAACRGNSHPFGGYPFPRKKA
ncbi:hypothetical protein [Desulfospira joergensenii]|uniref:hypothetical protein n=1 Tax=Desulfospira joergensenii TaxID=53329 RepID=UPI001376C937|nr:hypothetical protein [Desulfospira joergensenii]